jgi:hypothetical protein
MRRSHAAQSRFGGSETELGRMFELGADSAPAVRVAASRGAVYDLTLERPQGTQGTQGPLLVRVRPAHRDHATSIQLDVRDENFTLSVTAVFNAKRDARHAARMSIPPDHYENVQRIINARATSGEVCVFVSGSVPERQSQGSIVTAIRLIAGELVELGLASERTLTVVNIENRRLNLGTPMYEQSYVLVGTIGRILSPSSKPDEALRILFEGGAWAVNKDEGTFAREIPAPRESPDDPPLTISVQTGHTDTAGLVVVRMSDPEILLVVVHDALLHAETILRYANWWPGLTDDGAIDRAVALMRTNVTRASEIVIFAFSYDASQRGRMQRAMRALYDLGLTAQQPHKDACVVLCHGDGSGELQMGSTRLLIIIRDSRIKDKRANLRQREIGNQVARITPVTPVSKKPKLGDRAVRDAPVGTLAELPKRTDGPCTVS